jgi:hypothetical protein
MPSVDPAAEPPPPRGGAFDYSGAIHWEYSPELDHEPDPGEVVWTWVAYEEDASVGKDRPVAVVGRTDDRRLVALMLSSRDHDDDRGWISIGTGPWDRQGRESWVRRDRILAVHATAVRREGAILPRPTYESIVRGLQAAPARTTRQPSSGAAAAAAGSGLMDRLRRLVGRPRKT